MAAMCSSVSYAFVKKASPVVKPERKAWTYQTRKLSQEISDGPLIRSSIKNKVVYEDQSEGVICHTNEDGEMICEGFDEGPRFHQDVPKTPSHPTRYAEIFDLLLQRRWLQIVKELGEPESEWLQHTLLMVIYKSSVGIKH